MAPIAEVERRAKPKRALGPEVEGALKRELERDRELSGHFDTALEVVRDNQRGIVVPADMKKLAQEMRFHATIEKGKLTREKIKEIFDNIQHREERRWTW